MKFRLQVIKEKKWERELVLKSVWELVGKSWCVGRICGGNCVCWGGMGKLLWLLNL